MTCFEKQQQRLIDFLGAVAQVSAGATPAERITASAPPILPRTQPLIKQLSFADETSVRDVNAGLKLVGLCQREGFDDAGQLLTAAASAETEWPLLKGYCQYVGFNGREVDGLFLLTNRRLLLFSSESGAKIVLVELTRRLLDKVPFPFFDSVVCFFVFSIPRAIYVEARGGHEKLIERSLGVDAESLLANKPPLRKVQDYDLATLVQNVSQIELGTGIWTGILARKFGVSFSPAQLTKTFSIPKDLILPEYETLEPFERLLHAAEAALRQHGFEFRVDDADQRLVLRPASAARKAAA